MDSGFLLILTGPTASGKTAVYSSLAKKYPHLSRVVTTTSRSPRSDERDGKDYYFVSKEGFEKMIQQDKFLEYVQIYSGNYYGTTRDEIKKVLDDKSCVWIIDVTRAAKVDGLFDSSFEPETARQLIKKTLIIYINCPVDVIRLRLRDRGMNEALIDKRIQEDIQNWQDLKDHFKNVVINKEGELDQTTSQIIKLIENV